jgi:hypothetical protein
LARFNYLSVTEHNSWLLVPHLQDSLQPSTATLVLDCSSCMGELMWETKRLRVSCVACQMMATNSCRRGQPALPPHHVLCCSGLRATPTNILEVLRPGLSAWRHEDAASTPYVLSMWFCCWKRYIILHIVPLRFNCLYICDMLISSSCCMIGYWSLGL